MRGSRSVGAGWQCGPVAPFSGAEMKRRDKRRCVRGRGHGKGMQQVAALVVKCLCIQALHTHVPMPP